ncbi:hypothetical protein Pla123a_13360 [Posidoniimonas polymericola]|uniref:Uncharacterized protein n=1 Tax=Posidoniimonas polymericola TaxID=2528002 RepID=A0A5C5YV83_9BACT|nr:hypothetical protein [Posidoniimonas polymericola]TWT78543.1 hypothetical protein Pla123a_13360 [Posidoniimonas polymericola]
MPDENPYASPVEVDEPQSASAPGSADAVRRAHLQHESAVRSLGTLYLLLAIAATMLTVVVGGFMASEWGSRTAPASNTFVTLGIASYLLTPVVLWGLAIGLHGLRGEPTRLAANGLHAVGLVVSLYTLNPIFAIHFGYALWQLTGKRAKFLFSRHYREVIAATPYLKPSTSTEVKIVAFLLLLMVGFIVIGLLF